MLAGRSLPHAVMMMIPEAYQGRDDLSDELKGFYAFHSCLMEPWDGPAAVAFTNGRVVGATLDRNGLRPGRWVETKDGWVVLGSETGMLDIEPGNVKRLGRLQPGKLFLVDLEQGRIVEDEEVKREVSTQKPYADWFRRNVVHFNDLEPAPAIRQSELPLRQGQLAFGYTQEDLKVLLAPMVRNAEEPIGSMGNDNALAVLQRQPPAAVHVLQAALRPGHEPADRPDPRGDRDVARHRASARRATCSTRRPSTPTSWSWTSRSCATRSSRRCGACRPTSSRRTRSTSPGRSRRGPRACRQRLADACDEAYDAIEAGVNILILSDRAVGPERAPIPSLLAVAADPPPPRARGHAPAGGPRARVRRAARGPPLRDADRLRRERDQPLRHARHDRRADGAGTDRGRRRARRRRAPRGQGDRQGPAQDDLQDGDLDDPVLLRRADLRGRRPREDARRPPLHRHGVADRRRRPRGPRPGGARPPRARVARRARRPAPRRRHLRLAPRRRAAHVEPGDDRAAAARGARERGRERQVPRVRRAWSTRTPPGARRCAACSPSASDRGGDPARGGRAGGGDRQALRHRRDVARVDLAPRRTRRSRSR